MASHAAHPLPVARPVLTLPFIALCVLAGLTLLMIPWRFWVGLGPATGLNDGYPWGLWKIINVILLTAWASGGYATALLVYGLNRQRYHPLARLAIATSAVGYTSGVIALGVVDLGRPWNFWRLADISGWNLHSVLLEVGVCVSLYLVFLWLEMAPPFLERWRTHGSAGLQRLALLATPVLERAYPYIVALAITLPTMHQSSLGSLFLLAGPRLHALWQTPMLPLLFLLNAWYLGLAAVSIAAMLAYMYWAQPLPLPLLRRLERVNALLVLVWLGVRFTDLAFRNALGRLLVFDRFSVAFLAEVLLLLPPALALIYSRREPSAGALFRMALVILTGGSLYRFNTCLIGFMPGDGWRYFPSATEVVMSAGMVALGILAFLAMVKTLPIVDAGVPARTQRAA